MDISKDIDFDSMTPEEQRKLYESIKEVLLEHGFEIEEREEPDYNAKTIIIETADGVYEMALEDFNLFDTRYGE